MPTGKAIDHDAFHAFLYNRAGRRGRIELQQTQLAAEIGVTKYTMSRIIAQMLEDGRLHQISKKRNNRGYFVVEDPETWKAEHGD